MTFKSPSGALYYYTEALICMCNARTMDVFCERVFLPKISRKVSTNRLDTMATIGFYVAQLSATCRFIIGCSFLENLGSREIARRLNEAQNTRRYSSAVVQELYRKNLLKLNKKLEDAGVVKRDSS